MKMPTMKFKVGRYEGDFVTQKVYRDSFAKNNFIKCKC